MNKIGLLSVYNHNYGSILQVYALQNVLINMGFDVKVILYQKTNIFKQAIRLFYVPLLKSIVKNKYKIFYCKLFKNKFYLEVLVPREQEFTRFVAKNIRFSRIYRGRAGLIEANNDFDVFVLGSDQVWNPMNLGSDYFTMTFIKMDKKKITYAPSFGVAVIPAHQRKKTTEYLQRIDYISVREITRQNIVKELTGRNVPIVVDPTILLSRNVWDKERGEPLFKEKYIMCYFISTIPSHREFAKKLAEKTGLKIVTIPYVDEYTKVDEKFGDIVPKAGPLQFVNLISNAEYVCTDSFHGTIFSILYGRTFFTFRRYAEDVKDSTNSRLSSILHLLGLEQRMFDSADNLDENLLRPVNYVKPNKLLEQLRKESQAYLENALREI